MKKIYILFLCVVLCSNVLQAQYRYNTNGLTLKRIWLDHKSLIDNKIAPFSDWSQGIEFGYTRHVTNWFNVSVPVRIGTINSYKTNGELSRSTFIGGLDVMGQIKYFNPDKLLTLYATAGVGSVAEKLNNLGLQVPIGAGLNVKIIDDVYLNLQSEYRYGLKNTTSNLQHSIGFLILMGGEKKAKTPPTPIMQDKDKDGVADDEDTCPDIPGLVLMNGCPDSDGDKVIDSKDLCPTEAGSIALKGCPDRDKDGIADKDDKCPDQAGPAKTGGCPMPDADGDGVADTEDACPNAAGLAAMSGCPDRDADGVADKDDACPDEAGTTALNGCADTDGDGVANSKDKCPTEAGTLANSGCPEVQKEIVKEAVKEAVKELKKEDKDVLNLATKMVQFETSRAILLKSSSAILDQIADILKAHPEYKLNISGHTDNIGDAKRNLRLSDDRAKACRDAFVTRGIDAKRMTFAGFGKTKPIADNKTKEGREKNRRVEFDLSY